MVAGEEGNLVLKLFRISCSKHTNKDKISRWELDTARLSFAFEVYGVTDKERAFRYVAVALSIFNGEADFAHLLKSEE